MNPLSRLFLKLKLGWLERRKNDLDQRLLGNRNHPNGGDTVPKDWDDTANLRLLEDYQRTLSDIGRIRYKLDI